MSDSSQSLTAHRQSFGRRLLFSYFYLVLKNLVGWIQILASGPVGFILPGPGGLPMFLIGFAMISFPGKRKLTARAMCGRPIDPASRVFQWVVPFISFSVPAIAIFWLNEHVLDVLATWDRLGVSIALYMLAAPLLWLLGLRSYWLLNLGLYWIARMRRRVRPWLRRKGIDLLPPRRRRRPIGDAGLITREPDPEILQIHDRHFKRLWRMWASTRGWIRRAFPVAVTLLVLYFVVRPIYTNWANVREPLASIHALPFITAVGMFILFLGFRAISWRWILKTMGHRVPVLPAVRIWCTSELSRYVPGTIWQLVGRVYLLRPYGVRVGITATSQVVEQVVFLLANILVGLACLIWALGEVYPSMQGWRWVLLGTLPLAGVLLHPRLFYGIMGRLLTRLRRPPLERRLSGVALLGLLTRMVAALLWQAWAIWLILHEPLNLEPGWWWAVAGAYCLAWAVGFMAVWAPGGLGVRELVFLGVMQIILPYEALADTPHPISVILALAILLRIWTTASELIFSAIAYILDTTEPPASPPETANARATGGGDAAQVAQAEEGGAVADRAVEDRARADRTGGDLQSGAAPATVVK